MDTVQFSERDLHDSGAAAPAAGVQPCAWLLELSPDWIVRRASENIHHLLHESHVTLIDEPLGRFVHAQALHDLRNLFSRLSGTLGIARAYSIRLTDEYQPVDIAFQLSEGHVLLEAVHASGSFGERFGSVGGLIQGLAGDSGQDLFDHAARRMRALTGYDRVILTCGPDRAESSRGSMKPIDAPDSLPVLVADSSAAPVGIFPRGGADSMTDRALMCAPAAGQADQLRNAGIAAVLRVPFASDGVTGEFRCDSRSPREPSFELQAAAELFAQGFATRVAMDRLRPVR